MSSPLAPIDIQLKRLPHGADLSVPAYATAHAAVVEIMLASLAPCPAGASAAKEA